MREAGQVWYVRGEPGTTWGRETLLNTKLDAEQFARKLFPDEDVVQRYARIFYRNVFTFQES